MRIGVYGIYDRAVAAYLPPFQARSDGEAKRMFVASVKNNKDFAENAKDYHLWKLSVFDDQSGSYGTMASDPDLPKPLLTGLEAVALARGVIPERTPSQADMALEGSPPPEGEV